MTSSRKTELPGLDQALQRTASADQAVRALLRSRRRDQAGIAVLAAGGYGRCDNALRSDLDLIVLHTNSIQPHENALRLLIQGLWDQGWSPGQTLLSMDELDAAFFRIPDRASAILEARFVWGDRSIPDLLGKRLNTVFSPKVWDDFITIKLQEVEQRHRKYGSVPRVIEPHLKGQAGGLRDLHYVFWIELARQAVEGRWKLRLRRNAPIPAFIGRLQRVRLLTESEARDLRQSYDWMLQVREALRQVTTREEDLLFVQLQPEIALQLGINGGERQRMRLLMRHTYRAMEKLARFAEEFGSDLAAFGTRRVRKMLPVSGFPRMKRSGHRLYFKPEEYQRIAASPDRLLQLVDICAGRGWMLSGRARHAIRREVASLWPKNFDRSREWAESLRGVFQLQKGVGKRIRMLSELDALQLWLPEWRGISGLTTGSLYHRYTVDEHTIRALDELDNLPDDAPEKLPLSLWRDFPRKDWLYLSVLFHDIGKGRRGEHCAVGSQMAREALNRLGWEDLVFPVSRLVHLHLRMEQVAFRRDSTDPEVISSFAAEVGDVDTLKALYLLTVVDLRAVRKEVWTTWKGQLLAELYLAVHAYFQKGIEPETPTLKEELEILEDHLEEDTLDRQKTRKFLKTMPEEYRRAIPAEEVANHLDTVSEVRKGKSFDWQIEQEQGYILLTLITRDRVGLLADIAGLLVSQGIGIREARIFTSEEGIVIDRFRAEDIWPDGAPVAERIRKIPILWEELINKQRSIAQMIEGYRRRFRRQRPPGFIESEVHLSPSGDRWMVEIAAQDSVGLLFSLCSVFSLNGLDVNGARITGRLDGIQDTFILQDPEGFLDDRSNQEWLLQQLRKAIESSS